MLDKKGNDVLDGEVNHKLSRGTRFEGDSISVRPLFPVV